jgi:hypothetical protein
VTPRFTRLLMSASALVLGVLGVVALFAPDAVLGRLGGPVSSGPVLLVQVLGALYAGFAALNWMTRGTIVGGIYSRPVVIGNLTHFMVAGLAMLRVLGETPSAWALWLLTATYATFAALFAIVMMRHPVRADAGRTQGPVNS